MPSGIGAPREHEVVGSRRVHDYYETMPKPLRKGNRLHRRSLPPSAEARLVTDALRRCCMCYWLESDREEKDGQIAHIDRVRSNNSASNMVFLCLRHHAKYDSKSHALLGYKPMEVKVLRDAMIAELRTRNTTHGAVLPVEESDLQAVTAWADFDPLAKWDTYPVVMSKGGVLTMDWGLSSACCSRLLHEHQPRAAHELLHLIHENRRSAPADVIRAANILRVLYRHSRHMVESANKEMRDLFSLVATVLSGLEATMGEWPMEMVLHDTRNPLQSIVYISSSSRVTKRRIGGPMTDLGLFWVKWYSAHGVHLTQDSYRPVPARGAPPKAMKSTTIPLVHNQLGLFGFVCVNIDLSRVSNAQQLRKLVNSFTRIKFDLEESHLLRVGQFPPANEL